MALKRSAQAGRKCTVNKGSEVREQRPTNGLPLDQVLLSSLSRPSSKNVEYRSQITGSEKTKQNVEVEPLNIMLLYQCINVCSETDCGSSSDLSKIRASFLIIRL